MAKQAHVQQTLLDALIGALLKCSVYNKDDAVAPAAVLWPDEKCEWTKLIPALRGRLPQFVTLGAYDESSQTGPAIWVRSVLAGKIASVNIPNGNVPILYLPGVGRSTLRATEDCPAELKPLAELQYRGVLWSQQNAKDWTVSAFLQTENGGLGLKLAKDNASASSLKRALDKLVDVSVSELAAKSLIAPLDSDYFDQFVTDDPVDDLLSWLSDPKGTRERWQNADGGDRWDAMRGRCRTDYGFDCEKDGEIEGGRLLGLRHKPAWKTVWKRFAAAPVRYPGLPDLLRRAKPPAFATDPEESWPQDNEAEESDLRAQLLSVRGQPPAAARQLVDSLDARHAKRRDWVWNKLGRSPLAAALQHVHSLAEVTATPLAGASTDDMIAKYTSKGWRADAALLDSLATVTRVEDVAAIRAVIDCAYVPWVRDSAELFQNRVSAEAIPGAEVDRLGPVSSGTCIFFVDGLRYDVGQKLLAALEGRQMVVSLRHHTSSLPSVTPTAKPAISPVAEMIKGLTPGEDFNPSVGDDGKDLDAARFRKLLTKAGYQILLANQTGDSGGIAWTEHSAFDQTGHNEGAGLARRVAEILEGLVTRIETLIEAGWQEVRIVTDHGWLLLPGGLPKAELPKYLTATQWGRCAIVKSSSSVDFPCFHWHWASGVRVACPHGIDCFTAGKEYNHGGLSLQECVVPQLAVRGRMQKRVSLQIEDLRWAGLRCRIKVFGDVTGCTLDFRDKAADPLTSIGAMKPIGKDGSCTLLVADDSREGTTTNLVLLDAAGVVLLKMPVNIGG